MMSPLSKAEREAAEEERQEVTQEAKKYVERLKFLTELMAEWAEEGWDHDVA